MTEPDFVSRQTTQADRYYLDLNPDLDTDLCVVCGGFEHVQDDYVIQRREFPYYAIEVVADGTGELTMGGAYHEIAPGSIFAYGPGVPHKIENRPPGGMRKYFLDFVGREAIPMLDAAGLGERKPILVGHMGEVTHLMDLIARESHSNDGQITQDLAVCMLRAVLLKIRQRRITDGTRIPAAYQTYENARSYMDANFKTLNTIEQVAQACNVTPIYLSRLFKRYAETGAYRFLLRRRMNYAAELLLEEGVRVRDVAEILGYADAFQFSRAFKRIHGVPPKTILDSRRKNE